MKNIEQIVLPCIAALCLGLMVGILIGRFGAPSSVQLSTYDKISENIPTQTAPYRFESAGKININTASKEELTMIPGIGATNAENIVAYRLRYGPFLKIEDITKIKGIGTGRFENIKDYITVGG